MSSCAHLRRRSKEKRVDLLTSATNYIASVTVTIMTTEKWEIEVKQTKERDMGGRLRGK